MLITSLRTTFPWHASESVLVAPPGVDICLCTWSVLVPKGTIYFNEQLDLWTHVNVGVTVAGPCLRLLEQNGTCSTVHCPQRNSWVTTTEGGPGPVLTLLHWQYTDRALITNKADTRWVVPLLGGSETTMYSLRCEGELLKCVCENLLFVWKLWEVEGEALKYMIKNSLSVSLYWSA